MSRKPSFDIDAAKLEGRFKALQKELHPDKFGNATADERHYAANYSSLVNASYNVLKDPLQRAQLLVRKTAKSQNYASQARCDSVLLNVMDCRALLDQMRPGRRDVPDSTCRAPFVCSCRYLGFRARIAMS